jgi:predicted amidohydrolase
LGFVKIAAYQAPLLPSGSMAALPLIRRQVERCESEGVEILCCPEAILGGLADYASDPTEFALTVHNGQLENVLAPLASDFVTTIIGFTEINDEGALYNSAAVFHRGAVIGIYRKIHPAIRRSVYQPGEEVPVFQVSGLTFGIIICYDSNFPEFGRMVAANGATALFIPTDGGLPEGRADVVSVARKADLALAQGNGLSVIRADTVGQADGRVSFGSSEIVDASGNVVQSARRLTEELIIAEIQT